MTDYTTNYALPFPLGEDRVAVAADVKALADKASLELGGVEDRSKWDRGIVPVNTDLDTLTTPGVYSIPDSTTAQSLLHRPPIAAVGHIEVAKASEQNGVIQQTLIGYSNDGRGTSYRRQSVAGAFSQPWETLTWPMGNVANGTNWDTVLTAGVYSLDNRSAAGTHANLPPSEMTFAGVMEVLPVAFIPTPRVMQRGTEYASGKPGLTWQRMQNIDGTFQPWEKINPDTGTVPVEPYRHDLLEQAARKRRGGKYGTGGKTLVALRLDDSYTALISKVIPLLQERGIPASIAVTSQEWDNPYNVGTTWAELQTVAINNGLEVWNHSNNHTDANTVDALQETIVGALGTIRANMPKVSVDGFIPPGVGSSGSGYMGFNQGDSPEAFYDTPAGRILLNHHALVTGNMESCLPLDGQIKHGVRHLGLDSASFVTEAQNQIVRSIGAGVGIVPMLHPYHLDEVDRTTTARFESFLDFLVQYRDAGDIELVTIGALMTADAGTNFRHDLARPEDWVNGEQAISLADQPYVKGGIRELSAAGSADVTLSVADDIGSLNVTRTLTPGTGRARLQFMIPTDATSITCTVTGGTDPHVYAV